jgi:hypothetical protein
MRQIAVACKGLQLFWFALRITVFWVVRSVQVVSVVAAAASVDEMAKSVVARKMQEINTNRNSRNRRTTFAEWSCRKSINWPSLAWLAKINREYMDGEYQDWKVLQSWKMYQNRRSKLERSPSPSIFGSRLSSWLQREDRLKEPRTVRALI